MKYMFFAGLFGILVLTWAAVYCAHICSTANVASAGTMRIVSLAPSITETLCALGCGNNLVGITQYCTYPQYIQNTPRVGGFDDAYHEAIVRLHPTLVALPYDKKHLQQQLTQLQLPIVVVETRTLKGLCDSIIQLGKATHTTTAAQQLYNNMQQAFTTPYKRADHFNRPRTLICVMHSNMQSDTITEITAIGDDAFYNELISLAGGVNAYTGKLAYPRLSYEAILQLNPQIIIDISADNAMAHVLQRMWGKLSTVEAVRNGRIYTLPTADHSIPGPRTTQTLAVLTQLLHPDTRLQEK